LAEKIKKKVRIRLSVSLAILTGAFTLGSGLMTLELSKLFPYFSGFPLVVYMILVLTAISCISAIIFVRGVTKPLNEVASFIGDLILEGKKMEIVAPNEPKLLAYLVKKATSSRK